MANDSAKVTFPHDLPYLPISAFYLQHFGFKPRKISVSIADDCPNRAGLRGMETCSFCDVWGSAARSELLSLSLPDQIKKFRQILIEKFHSRHFLVYFQAYTNTFTKLQNLRQAFADALAYEDVHGIIVSTRPDCISQGVLDLWEETAQTTYFSVELGVQSFREKDLLFMKRGHVVDDSFRSIARLKKMNIQVGIHLIFGNPEESLEDIRKTAQICNSLGIHNVKLHNLHVLTQTKLAKLYGEGAFVPDSFEVYREKVRTFLSHLNPEIFVHRLAAYSPRWSELIAPQWTANKMATHQGIIDHMNANRAVQGGDFLSSESQELPF
jgi:uncharacterized protein